MGSVCIGIDFGTTKTLVSYFDRHRGEAMILRIGRGRDDIPTSLYAGKKKAFLFGEDADDMISTEPLRYARAFKLELGSTTTILGFFEDECEDEWVEYTAEELTAEYLRNIRLECEKVLSAEIESVVITRPVRFSPVQCDQLEKAARAAGLPEPRFISEPEAAAHAFCRQNGGADFHNALVVDWGGGTLDMSLVTLRDDRVETYRQYTDGVLRGGEDFDDALLDYIEERLDAEHGLGSELKSDREDEESKYTIRRKIRAVKESLSKLQQESVRLSGRKRVYPAITITRDEFVLLISDDVHRAAMQAKQLIASIGDAALKPELIILVGGSSRIPAISEMLSRETGLPCRTWDMSMEAVGTGAALVAQGITWGRKNLFAVHNAKVIRWVLGIVVVVVIIFCCLFHDTVEDKFQEGVCYVDGNGVAQDVAKGLKLIRAAAEQGYAPAQNYLGNCYANGRWVGRNPTKAVEYYRKAADLEHAWAQYNLGNCYYNGQGVAQSHEKAVKWYRKAAKKGINWAQYKLGECYYNGQGGVKKDVVEAVKWYRKAAEQGIDWAQYKLGEYYAKGEGDAQKNPAEAVKWYRKAADQGNDWAQYKLGECYENGYGFAQKNPTEAVKWYRMAADQGNAEAKSKLDRLN